MPRIPDALLRAVGFLYPSQEAAGEARMAGGTAFLVEVLGTRTAVVTNLHVAAGGCHWLRLQTRNRRSLVLTVGTWTHHPDGDDVAVALIDLPEDALATPLIWNDLAATPERLDELNAGVGDEVVMIGRFVAHDGVVRPNPLARFGNIAMMPGERVQDGRGVGVEAFLVEMRSLSGFSGSPVFIYMGPGTYRGDGRMMPFFEETIGLIGIDTGHKIMRTHVVAEDGQPTAMTVQQHTGISIVAPVWKIAEALNEALA